MLMLSLPQGYAPCRGTIWHSCWLAERQPTLNLGYNFSLFLGSIKGANISYTEGF